MNQERVFQVLVGPHASEKSMNLEEGLNQYVFKVASDASKDEIKQAVEQLFSVKVTGVRVVNIAGKLKVRGRIRGRRSDVRKAYISLQEGHKIDLGGATA